MRIHLAANDFDKFDVASGVGHPHALWSYWYIKQKTDPAKTIAAFEGMFENTIVDSGLFSFMFGSEKGTIDPTLDAYLAYTKQYIEDMADWNYNGVFVESDVHKLLGMEAVWRLREEYAPLGPRIIYVWHLEEGLDGLLEMARRFDYIAISLPELRMIGGANKVGGRSREANMMAFDLLRRVHDACGSSPPRIHLLGCTSPKLMQSRLAFSCDSTSWISGVRHRTPLGYVDGKLVGMTSKTRFEGRKRHSMWRRHRAKVLALNAEKFAALNLPTEGYHEDLFVTTHGFAEYQRWLDAHYQHVPMKGAGLPPGAVES